MSDGKHGWYVYNGDDTMVVRPHEGIATEREARLDAEQLREQIASADRRRARAVMAVCSHLDQIRVTALPASIDGCEECLKIGSSWVHLRMCMTCGKIGCCDSSPNRHASRHAREASHPIVRSAEPGEEWSWCFLDEVGFVVETSGAASSSAHEDARP